MRFDRQSGVFCHVTSLPGRHGIGDLGAGATAFLDFLDAADQSLWQVCPLGPTTAGAYHSPYQTLSGFAGDPLLVALDPLGERGYLTDDELEPPAGVAADETRYDVVSEFKRDRLRTAFERFRESPADGDREAFAAFREREAAWLEDYALFVACKREFDGAPWTEWPDPIRAHDDEAVARRREALADDVAYHAFCQWLFDRQWRRVADAAHERGIDLVGDLPIYVAFDSADVWASPEAFQIEDGEPTAVAGVPPNPGDDGQRWGNPLYDWEELAARDYDWWLGRLRRLFELVDVTRIDHFKGFDEYWAIPGDSDDPADGEWRDAPGVDFFETVEGELGELPFLAEDLGFLDESVVALRDRFGFPGMRVPVYADWCSEGDRYQPMHYPEDSVGYTSTHDTDTFVGYYRDLPAEQRDCLHYNLGTDGEEIHWDLIEAVWNSNAAVAIAPLQDLLGLGSDARFNTPGTVEGNWQWRVTEDRLTDDVAERLARITDATLR